jgi:flagellar assembly protein FliH
MSGTVIKAGDARALTRGLYSLDLRDIAGKAEAMLSTARSEAARLVEEARRQALAEREGIRQSAQRKGYAEGGAAGRAAALEEARKRFAEEQTALTVALGDLLGAFGARREELYLAARRDVVVLAMAIAQRIVSRLAGMADAAPEMAAEACRQALELVGEATEAVIRVHPDDRRALEQIAEGLSRAVQSSRHLRLVEDPSVGRGGVVVETADCAVDAQAASRVDRIADELVTDWRQRMKALAIER